MSWLDKLKAKVDSKNAFVARNSRGLLATLRCALVESKRHRAWPALSSLGIEIDDKTGTLVAALYATHPKNTSEGNMGTVMRRIRKARGEQTGKDDGKTTPTERRFQQLISSERGNELNDRVVRTVQMAKSEGIPVNYAQLENDLRNWNEYTQQKWGIAFWSQNAKESPDEEPGKDGAA